MSLTSLKEEKEQHEAHMATEFRNMESTLKAKLQNALHGAQEDNEKLQVALRKQKADIDLVMELNESLKEKNKRLEEEYKKEKQKRADLLSSLSSDDTDKIRTSQRLQTQDSQMTKMNMLYNQVASEKSGLFREN